MNIPLLDLVSQYKEIKPEIDDAIQQVLDSGRFILGEEVQAFEQDISKYLGVNHSIGVASGTDALILSLRALDIGPGDEVILPAYTFFATISAVMHVGAKPVVVDVDPLTYCIDHNQVKNKISSQTKAIIPVHLYGHPANMDKLIELVQGQDITIIEDNAQAFGAEYKGQKTGTMGEISCLSFFPSKNLGGYGDGGMVVTKSPEIAKKIGKLRVHGWEIKYHPEILGYNSRLDTIQAAILRVKLKYVDKWNERRRKIAQIYTRQLSGLPFIQVPREQKNSKHVYHLYVIQSPQRDQIRAKLSEADISTGIYYPQPIHLAAPSLDFGYQPGDFPISEKASNEVLAIPIYPDLNNEQIEFIISTIRNVFT